jgi:hypothetical protein
MFALSVFAPASYADAVLFLTQYLGPTVVVDANSPQNSCHIAGCITYIGPVGDWNVNVTGLEGSASAPAYMALNSVDTHVGGGGILSTYFAVNDLTANPSGFLTTVTGTGTFGFGGWAGAWGGANNQLFSTVTELGTVIDFGFGISGPDSTLGFNSLGPEYSLLLLSSVGGSYPETGSFSAVIEAAPEPWSVSLLGTVLLCCATVRLLRIVLPR